MTDETAQNYTLQLAPFPRGVASTLTPGATTLLLLLHKLLEMLLSTLEYSGRSNAPRHCLSTVSGGGFLFYFSTLLFQHHSLSLLS